MKNNIPQWANKKLEEQRLRRLILLILCVWTAIIIGNLSWETHQTALTTQQLATIEARSNFNKDKALRLWAAHHGGVYVPITPHTPPNPNLHHVPERDIVTPSGLSLTLMNPAYMLRQVMNDYATYYGVRGKITSSKLLNESNAPDAWEQSALKEFTQGKTEIQQISEIDGVPHLRLMQPLHIKEDCLKCHAHQGYESGDIRGGVSIAISMAPYLKTQHQTETILLLSHLLLWSFVTITTLIVYRQRQKLLEQRFILQASLLESRQELQGERQRLQEIIWATHVGTWEWNLQNNHIVFNELWPQMIGYTLDEWQPTTIESWRTLIHPEDLARSETLLQQNFSRQLDCYECEMRLRHKQGHWIWVLNRGKVVEWNEEGQPIRLSGASREITARKQAEEALLHNEKKLTASLGEKEVLLREVHHRVKNNLQVISSLLQLQARKSHHDVAKALHESERRVKVMAQVHEKLCQSQDLKHINSHDYLYELIDHLEHSQLAQQSPLTIVRAIEPVDLNLDQSILVGQIFSELFSNAIKHAFPDERHGTIHVELHRTPGGRIELSVMDNGIGLPAEFDLHTSSSLGWQLVQALSAKLGANLELDRTSGTQIRLQFSQQSEQS